MSRLNRPAAWPAAAACAAAALFASHARAQAQQGPSSSQTPYLQPSVPGVKTVSILTTGDSINNKPNGDPYRMGGIPDGLGAVNNGDGTFTVLMNHELGSTSGIARAHGAAGAYISKWNISASPGAGSFLKVNSGSDQIQTVTGPAVTGPYAFNRFCSADLAPAAAFRNAATGAGTTDRLYLNGEETGGGKAWAHDVNTGATYQLPAFNNATNGGDSWENLVAHPNTGTNATLVMAQQDSTPPAGANPTGGRVFAYLGTKTSAGTPADQAGLTNGSLSQIKAFVGGTPVAVESRASGLAASGAPVLSGTFTMTADATGTAFQRPEDGAWDPSHPNDYYYATTDTLTSGGGHSRLWKLHYSDLSNPAAGGTISAVLDGGDLAGTASGGASGAPTIEMMDNIAIDRRGRIVIVEDVGNNARLGKVWLYDTNADSVAQIAEHDSARFLTGGASFLTQDEEASGVIDAEDILGKDWFLLDVQAHYGINGELVEGGQLLALQVPEPTGLSALGLGAAGLLARRRRATGV